MDENDNTSLHCWVEFSLSCPTLWDPMDYSTLGLPVHHQLPEFTQTHVHWVGDAIQSSHSLLSPSPSALNPSQHQGLFKWVSSPHQVAKVLEFQPSASVLPMNNQDWFPLGWTSWISLLSKDSQESSPTPQFKASILLHSALFIVQLSHPYMTTGKLKSTQFTVSEYTAVATLSHDLVGSCSSDRLSPGLSTQLCSKGSLRISIYVPRNQIHRAWADLGLQTGKLIKSLPQGSPKST